MRAHQPGSGRNGRAGRPVAPASTRYNRPASGIGCALIHIPPVGPSRHVERSEPASTEGARGDLSGGHGKYRDQVTVGVSSGGSRTRRTWRSRCRRGRRRQPVRRTVDPLEGEQDAPLAQLTVLHVECERVHDLVAAVGHVHGRVVGTPGDSDRDHEGVRELLDLTVLVQPIEGADRRHQIFGHRADPESTAVDHRLRRSGGCPAGRSRRVPASNHRAGGGEHSGRAPPANPRRPQPARSRPDDPADGTCTRASARRRLVRAR